MTDASWTSYPKIYNVGHAALAGFFDATVRVEEKVDGSQLSFGVFGGELRMRSRRRQFEPSAADRMFERAAEVCEALAPTLRDGWTYRGEYLQSPRHNSLAYDRTPTRHIVLFDIARGMHDYLSHEEVAEEAGRLGLESVPVLHVGNVASAEEVSELLDRTSYLGGAQVEGVVFKRVREPLFGTDGKPLMAKHVTERFREIHTREWSKAHKNKADIVAEMIAKYGTEARWHKAVQHMRDDGRLERSPRDIGALIKEVQSDIREECAEAIKDELYRHYIKHVLRGVTRGLPEWYKAMLLESAFGEAS